MLAERHESNSCCEQSEQNEELSDHNLRVRLGSLKIQSTKQAHRCNGTSCNICELFVCVRTAAKQTAATQFHPVFATGASVVAAQS